MVVRASRTACTLLTHSDLRPAAVDLVLGTAHEKASEATAGTRLFAGNAIGRHTALRWTGGRLAKLLRSVQHADWGAHNI